MGVGLYVELAVAVLLMVSIGYSVILNQKLKRLHADRDALKVMVADLVRATDMANAAIQGLREAATEADVTLGTRMQEAERFAVALANHVSAGQTILDKILRAASVARTSSVLNAPEEPGNRAKSALETLSSHQKRKDQAA